MDDADGEAPAVTDAAEIGEGDDTGRGLRRRAFIPSSSLSLLDELLLLDDDDEEDEDDELDDEESSTVGFDPSAAAFFARFARLFFMTNSNLSAASISRASRPRKGNFASRADRHLTAMCFRATRAFRQTS